MRITPASGWLTSAGLLTALLAALLTYAGGVLAGTSVDEERQVKRDGLVEIYNTRGDVRIIGWDQELIRVRGELDDLAEGLTFEVDGDKTLIKVEMPRRDINHGDGSDLRISVPREKRVEFSGVSTDVTLHDIDGGTAVRSVSGEVNVRGVKGKISIKSVSGDIELLDAGGRVMVSSVSGDLSLELKAREVSVDTVSGEVDMILAEFDKLSSSTISGDQDVEGQLGSSGRIAMKSVSGEISLQMAGSLNADIDVSTGPGGDISNYLTDDDPREMFPARSALQTRVGDGSGTIKINTVSGDVRLRGSD